MSLCLFLCVGERERGIYLVIVCTQVYFKDVCTKCHRIWDNFGLKIVNLKYSKIRPFHNHGTPFEVIKSTEKVTDE